MRFLIPDAQSEQPVVIQDNSEAPMHPESAVVLTTASDLLELYLKTDDNSALMDSLREIRSAFLGDLDQVETVKEIYGLIYWLLADNGIEHRGESLEETADRLGDIDIENDSERYTDLIFHLKDAVERIYDIELE